MATEEEETEEESKESLELCSLLSTKHVTKTQQTAIATTSSRTHNRQHRHSSIVISYTNYPFIMQEHQNKGNGGGLPPLAYSTKQKKPRKAYQSPSMVGFQQKIAMANQTSICNATEGVGRRTIREILESPQLFAVPIFQRRYCWTAIQWQTLLQDANRGLNLGKHSLGRLTCTNSNATIAKATETTDDQQQSRSLILDGQQRFTTVTILLAAIRDAILNPGDNDSNNEMIEIINKLLFPDQQKFIEYTTSKPNKQNNMIDMLPEGMELSFAKLIPTFCDRKPYYMSILPKDSVDKENANALLWQRPLEARRYFDSQLNGYSIQQLNKLAKSVLGGFHMLYFPIDIHTGAADGTDDLMVVYERLALRDATWTKPTRDSEYVSMDGVDMIRNLLLGSFLDDASATHFYKTYWLPIEQIVEGATSKTNTNNNAASSPLGNHKTLQTMFQDFLSASYKKMATDNDNKHEEEVVINAGVIGGKIYAEFQFWFQKELASSATTTSASAPSCTGLEDKVNAIGKTLLEFSKTYFFEE